MTGARVLGAAAVFLFACGGAPPPQPVAPTVQSAPAGEGSLPRAPQADALRAVSQALEGAGHACHMAGETLVCDDKKENVVTVGVVWANEPNLGPYIGLVASFNWKEANGCATSQAKLNELNSKFDLLRSSCTDENLVFALTEPLGERGLTIADVRGLVTYFQSLVGAVLRSSDLVPMLK